jgi:nickel-dependent lactate racemase
MPYSPLEPFVLKYGWGVLSLPPNLPPSYELLNSPFVKPLMDPKEYIDTLLNSPTDCRPFNDFFTPGDNVVIVISDSTRFTLSDLYLPLLIDRLNHNGISDNAITLLCALGIHRKQTRDEQIKLIGSDMFNRIRLVNHDAFDRTMLTRLGTTTRGTPIEINRLLTEADKVILTGSIRFHYFAGFSGGRKSILPGVASSHACVANHLLVLNPHDQGGRHPHARTGVLEHNPIHEDMQEACDYLRNIFLFNTIVSPQRELLKAVAGDSNAAFNQGCHFLKKHFSLPLSRKADLVVASCGGNPWDINMIQAHKTMDTAAHVLKEGGVMILVAACSEGMGNPRFLDWFTNATPSAFEKNLRTHYEINGQTAYATFLKAKKHPIILISNLPSEAVRKMSLIPASTLEEAFSRAYSVVGPHPTTYIIPEGSSILPAIV